MGMAKKTFVHLWVAVVSVASLAISSRAVPAQSLAPSSGYNFANLQWGSTPSMVADSLKARSYSRKGDEASNEFEGELNGRTVTVLPLFAGGRLTILMVLNHVEAREAVLVYEDVQKLLTAKYGKPTAHREEVLYPYSSATEMDGAAVSTSHVTYVSRWGPTDDAPGDMLGVAITSSQPLGPTVSVVYQSAASRAALKGRSDATRKDY